MARPACRARAAIRALQRWYVRHTGLWETTGWWNAANALTAVIRYTRYTGDQAYAGVIGDTFTAARYRHAGFINGAWALRAWEWLDGSGLISPGGLVNDGLTAACANNGGTTWTYNQGVILGGLAALYQITGDRAGVSSVHPGQRRFSLAQCQERGRSVRAALGWSLRPGRRQPTVVRPRSPYGRRRSHGPA